MNKKLVLTIALLMVLICVCSVSAEVSVGVKKGDWVEYQVNYTGNPPEGHDVAWARMEIMGIQEKSVNAEITVEHSDGTKETITTALNLETGQLGDDFIVPADLSIGDTFFDKNTGYIAISNVEEKTYAGATRIIVYAATSETSYYWDKATGVLVEGKSSFPLYAMNTVVIKTNIWQSQLFGLDPLIFYVLVIAAILLVVIGLMFLIFRRKKWTYANRVPPFRYA